jgi:hypothetical protein
MESRIGDVEDENPSKIDHELARLAIEICHRMEYLMCKAFDIEINPQ